MKFSSRSLKIFGILLALGLLEACRRQAPDDDAKPTPNALISGTIELSEATRKAADPLSVLFIILRSPEGGMVAVKKALPPFQFPMAFRIEEGDVMIRGTDVGESFKVHARLDRDGDANPAQKGDILGQSSTDTVKKGSSDVRIVLDKVVE